MASVLGRRFKEGSDPEAPWITVVGVSPGMTVPLAGGPGADSVLYFTPLQQADRQSVSILTLFILFGVVTLGIALVGLYGVLSFSVGQRVKEMGVRMALGAQGRDVVRLFLRQGLIQIALGIGLGLGVGFGLSQMLGNFLFGVETGDPMVFGIVTLVVAGVGFLATWLPAQKASAVDPMVALRTD